MIEVIREKTALFQHAPRGPSAGNEQESVSAIPKRAQERRDALREDSRGDSRRKLG